MQIEQERVFHPTYCKKTEPLNDQQKEKIKYLRVNLELGDEFGDREIKRFKNIKKEKKKEKEKKN